YIGLGMVTFGFSLGALKEYFHHHLRGAFGKIGGIAFAWGITIIGLGMIRGQLSPADHPIVFVGLGLLVGGALLLIGGEGLQMGGMGVIEVVSHVLSYTRLVGILLASAVLALVAKIVEARMQASYGVGGLAVGVGILVVIAVFNIVLGVFEPGIQGARLIFVENFSKYYTGNGKAFRPLGTRRTHTAPTGPALPPAPTPP
ncbi:MAG TPA: V-type ATP synthase subunit I, partial [Thermoplasmata archaeon]